MPAQNFRNLYLLLMAAFCLAGVLQTVTQYPFRVPDEDTHWIAAVSRANALLPGHSAECDPLLVLPEKFPFKPDTNHHVFRQTLGLPSACVHSRMNYGFLFSYPGVVVAVAVRLAMPMSGMTVFYVSRLLEGAMVAFLLWLVLSQVAGQPKSYWKRFTALILAFLVFTPIGLQQSFAVSVDPLVNGFALLVVYWMWKTRLTRGDAWVFALVGSAAAITKPPLLAWIFPLVFWLQANGKLDKRGKWAFWLGTLAITLATLGYSYFGVSSAVPNPGCRPAEQLAFLLHNPMQGLGILWASVQSYLLRPGLLSSDLGAYDFSPTPATQKLQQLAQLLALFLFLFPLALAWRTAKCKPVRLGRMVLLSDVALFFGVWVSSLLVVFFLYLFWSAPQAPVVDGMQMRYLLCHFLILVGWLGVRLDASVPLSFNTKDLPRWVWRTGYTLLAMALLAFAVERSFSNLVAYF